MSNYTPIPIQIEPTFTPTTDNTALAGGGFTAMNNIQFFDGAPETIPGWVSVVFTNSGAISGKCRMLYSQIVNGSKWLLAGTHTRLYGIFGSSATNITPLLTATTNLGNNPITTYYDTLGTNPLTTVNGSKNVTVAHTAHRFQVGDVITMSGIAGTLNGIPAGDFNSTHLIRTVSTNSYVMTVNTAATSGSAVGGAAIVVASGLITVADVAHGFSNGDRIALAAATATRGITAPKINKEQIIRNVATNTYDIMTSDTSTSAGTGGGTAPVTRRGQIAAGLADASSGVGYGANLYSSGQYSEALVSAATNKFPRIWSAARYGIYAILTPGDQKGVYEWDGNTVSAPVPVTNAPTAVNYIFVDRDQIITLGAGGIGNRIETSDRGGRTVWTGTSQNEVYQSTIAGAGEFKSQANINGVNLLFTDNEVYTMSYLGKPAIWEVKPKLSIGIIARNARVVIEEVCYFMGSKNIYSYDGSTLRPLLTDKWRKYLYENLNETQKYKCFLSYREKYSQLVIRWPSDNSSEPDMWMRYDIRTGNASTGTKDRTAEEYPFSLSDHPFAIDSASTLYMHEFGVNADGAPMNWYLESSLMQSGKNVAAVHGVWPDSIQVGNISFDATFMQFAQGDALAAATLTITPTSGEVIFDETTMRGRFWKYRLSGNVLNGYWRGGSWNQLVTLSTPRI